jgi:hypothetical protein
VVLTADKIATEHIFKDKCYISLDEAKETLVDRNFVSDNERCYKYLMDKVAMNMERFTGSGSLEKWGTVEDEIVYFYPQAFEDLCKAEGFSKKSFLSWAEKKYLLETDRGRNTKTKKIGGKAFRTIALHLEEVDENGFVQVDMGDLPFEK